MSPLTSEIRHGVTTAPARHRPAHKRILKPVVKGLVMAGKAGLTEPRGLSSTRAMAALLNGLTGDL